MKIAKRADDVPKWFAYLFVGSVAAGAVLGLGFGVSLHNFKKKTWAIADLDDLQKDGDFTISESGAVNCNADLKYTTEIITADNVELETSNETRQLTSAKFFGLTYRWECEQLAKCDVYTIEDVRTTTYVGQLKNGKRHGNGTTTTSVSGNYNAGRYKDGLFKFGKQVMELADDEP
eukprot:188739_1